MVVAFVGGPQGPPTILVVSALGSERLRKSNNDEIIIFRLNKKLMAVYTINHVLLVANSAIY